MSAPTTLPRWGRRNEKGFYSWEWNQYPSVTTILKLLAGEPLQRWNAKTAALACAKIIERKRAGFLTQEEADLAILNWQRNMRAPEAERDYKGAIGSLCHHFLYEKALGVLPPINEYTDYLIHMSDKLNLARDEDIDDRTSYVQVMTAEARRYIDSAFRWIELADPEYEATGLEAMTISETYGYAGTMDVIWKLYKSRFDKVGLRWPFGAVLCSETCRILKPSRNMVRCLGDFKTSNSLADSVPMQVEAYANADFIGLPETGEKYGLGDIEATCCLWIRVATPELPDAKSEIKGWERSDATFSAFLAQLEVWGWLHAMPRPNKKERLPEPKKVKGPPQRRECPIGV